MEVFEVMLVLVFGLGLLLMFTMFVTVKQGTIAVVTIFGKYRRIMRPGLKYAHPGN